MKNKKDKFEIAVNFEQELNKLGVKDYNGTNVENDCITAYLDHTPENQQLEPSLPKKYKNFSVKYLYSSTEFASKQQL